MNAKQPMIPRMPSDVTMLTTADGFESKSGLTTFQGLKTTTGEMKKGT
jgi:hypothetical protein